MVRFSDFSPAHAPRGGGLAPQDRERLRLRAEELSAALPPLMVEAERTALSVLSGVHGRRRAGPGENFWQYRRYGATDPVQSIDWRQSARTDHLFVRENEWEAAQTVLLWRDASASMAYKSDQASVSKAERASVLLLALASLVVRAGERVGPLEGHFPPSTGQTALTRLAHHIVLNDTGATSEIPRPARVPRSGRVVLISDFLMDEEAIDRELAAFAGKAVRGHLLQVLDPAEIELPFSGRTLFFDMEGDGSYLAGRAEGLREAYREKLAAHQEMLRRLARRRGWSFTTHRTDEPAPRPLLSLYTMIAGPRRTPHAAG